MPTPRPQFPLTRPVNLGHLRLMNVQRLDGARVRLIRRNAAGSVLVELLESKGAYKKGDRVNVAAYEYEADEKRSS